MLHGISFLLWPSTVSLVARGVAEGHL